MTTGEKGENPDLWKIAEEEKLVKYCHRLARGGGMEEIGQIGFQ